ncbi:MAG: hypothetical protein ACREMP_06710 [Candidatus Tyrphobacter sp.]
MTQHRISPEVVPSPELHAQPGAFFGETSFDAYTMCSFLPDLDSSRAIPLVVIGYRAHEDPWFVWLVPQEGVRAQGLTSDPYYARVLADPRGYFRKKLEKYIGETHSVRRGIEMLVDCHQNHLAFTPLTELRAAQVHPLEVQLVGSF